MAINDVPAGLDQFVADIQNGPSINKSAQSQTEPEGLNEAIAPEMQEEKYGSLGEQAKTFAESAGKGLAGPIAPMLEESFGVNPEDIRGRAEANPATAFAGEAAGFVAPALATLGESAAAKAGLTGLAEAIPQLAKFTQLGAVEKIAAKLAPVAGETLASKIGAAAAKGAIENMLITGSDEVSRMVLKDPEQSAQSAIADLGMSAVLGGMVGGGAKSVSSLWDATLGNKASQLAADFKGRINEHMSNPDPVTSMAHELEDLHTGITGVADEVYGPKGLKAKDIESAVPSMHQGISSQVNEITDKVDNVLQKLSKDEHAGLLQEQAVKYKQAVMSDDPSKIFNATQELKQQLQEWGRFNKDIVPLKERPFRNAAKELAHDLRTSLEDTKIWGKAAERQVAINGAFKDYLPALRDFESTFMTKVGDDKVINPGKVNTYLNQLGNPSAEIKQSKLQNFIDASQKYHKVISDTHANLGLESPIMKTPLNVTMSTLDKQTMGSQLADWFIHHGLTDAGSATLGATIGGGLAHSVGLPHSISAIIGAKAIGPVFKPLISALAKPLFESAATAHGVKAAVEHTTSAIKGAELASKAVKNIFKLGVAILPEHAKPSDKEVEKLNKQLRSIQGNPGPIFAHDDPLQNIMPDHNSARGMMIGGVVNYLNSLRPDLDKKAPLDSKPVPSTTQKATYNAALQIAQQPLLVLEKVKNGTITAQDIQHIGTMFPQLYNGLKSQMMEEISNASHKDMPIPYKTRVGISMFMASPLDSTMTAPSIMAAQAKPMQQQQQMQAQQAQSKGVKSAPALQKMPKSYQTSAQSLEARHQRDK